MRFRVCLFVLVALRLEFGVWGLEFRGSLHLDVGDAVLLADGLDLRCHALVREHGHIREHVVLDLQLGLRLD